MAPKALLRASALTAAAAAALAAGVMTFYPYEAADAWRRAALRLSGVRRERVGPLAAWSRGTCPPGAPCRCVALVHGLGDSALTWDKLLTDARAGAPGLRLLALDMPGTDGSPPPPDPSGYAIPAQARTLRAALEGVCPRWTVVGNSLGGWTAMTLALDWPQGVADLVLVDPAGIADPSGRAEESARTLKDPTLASLKVFGARAFYSKRALPERAWASGLAAILRRPARATVEALRRDDLLDGRLGALAAPTAILWGEGDGIIPPAVGARLHALIKGSRWELIPRCGHLPQQECPETVARAVFGPAR